MAHLGIRFLKDKGASTCVLTVVRPDGTSTWKRGKGWFAVHDLAHFAVETTFGCRDGFYGLLARGWDIGDFGTPWPKGPPPDEVGFVEVVVSALQAAQAGQDVTIGEMLAANGVDRAVDPADLERARKKWMELLMRWNEVQPGQALELVFELAS